MQLRWLGGKWKHGKFKLQHREGAGEWEKWADVPVEDQKKEKPEKSITPDPMHIWNYQKKQWTCECCKPQSPVKEDKQNFWCDKHHTAGISECALCKKESVKEERKVSTYDYWCEHTKEIYVDDDWTVCPVCKAPRPVEKSLEEKFNEQYESWGLSMAPAYLLKNELLKIATDHLRSIK